MALDRLGHLCSRLLKGVDMPGTTDLSYDDVINEQKALSANLWSGTFVEDHPGRAKPVPELGKAEGEESLLHGHEDLAAVGERSVNSLRLVYAADHEGKIGATHGLTTRDVGA